MRKPYPLSDYSSHYFIISPLLVSKTGNAIDTNASLYSKRRLLLEKVNRTFSL